MLRLRPYASAVGVSMVAFLAIGLELPVSAESSPGPAAIVDRFLPGSTITLTRSHTSAADDLAIRLPASATPPGRTRLQRDFTYNELGWRAGVAAGLVNELTPIATFELTPATGTVPRGSLDALHGGFGDIELPVRPGTLDPSAALAQLKSNTAALKRVMPPGSVVKAASVLISSGAESTLYALEEDITVDHASSLAGHYGDVLEGLKTGLTGDLFTTRVEGLSIVVATANGVPVVGSWESTRAGGGTMQFAAPGAEPDALQVTTTFPDLTGGPSTRIGVTGRPGTASTLDRGKSTGVQAPRNPVARSSEDSSHALAARPSTRFLRWSSCTGPAVVAVALLILIRRLRARIHHPHD